MGISDTYTEIRFGYNVSTNISFQKINLMHWKPSLQKNYPLVRRDPHPREPLPVILAPDQKISPPTPEAFMTPATAEENELVKLAIDDLMQRLNIPMDEIALVDITNVVWPDGSLGCPKPGMFYTQALVEGTCIRLKVGDINYHYHSGRNQAPFLCENPADETGMPVLE
jgi:hypothetical protein